MKKNSTIEGIHSLNVKEHMKCALTIYKHHVFYVVSAPDIRAEKGIR